MPRPDPNADFVLPQPAYAIRQANRASVLRWIRSASQDDPTGWLEVLTAINAVMDAVATNIVIDRAFPDTVSKWPEDSKVIMTYVCRTAMDAAWIPDHVVARAAARDETQIVPLALALTTMTIANVYDAGESLASAIGAYDTRDQVLLTKYAAVTLATLGVERGDLLEIAASLPSPSGASG